MKKSYALALLAAAFLPAVAWAGNWDQYERYTAKYYTLDTKAFSSISCTLNDSGMDPAISDLVAAYAPGSVVVSHDVYSMVLSNQDDVKFTHPVLTIRAKDEDDEAEVASIPSVSKVIHSEFEGYLERSDWNIENVVGHYFSQDRKSIIIRKISGSKNNFTISAKSHSSRMDSTWTGSYRGPEVQVKSTQLLHIGATTLHELATEKLHYSAIDGMYVMTSTDQDALLEDRHFITKITVDYQVVSGIRFPKIVTWAPQPGSWGHYPPETLEFRECKVKR